MISPEWEGIDPGTLDLSGMLDLGSISLDLPQMPQMNLGDLMSSLNIQVTSEDMETMVSGLLEGYQAYAQGNPQADYSRLGEYFLEYLQTEEARNTLCNSVKDIMAQNGTITVSSDQIRAMFGEVLAAFQEYAAQNGLTDENGQIDPELFDDYLLEYLQTPEAQEILGRWGEEIFQTNGEVWVTQEQLETLAGNLAAGYQSYAQANGLPDPAQIGVYFTDYLNTEDAQSRLTQGLILHDRYRKSPGSDLPVHGKLYAAAYGFLLRNSGTGSPEPDLFGHGTDDGTVKHAPWKQP